MQRFVALGTGVVLVFLAMGTLFLGCGGGGGAVIVASITLTPADLSLNRGATAQITAQALDAGHNTITTPAIAYNIACVPAPCPNNQAPITISSSGLICAGVWDANFVHCQTTDSSNNLLPLGTVSITASTATNTNLTFTSSAVIVTDHERIDSIQVVPSPGNPTPGPGNPTGCFSQNGTPATTPNQGSFTVKGFSNDPASCQRISGSPSVPCEVPSSSIGSIDWSVSPSQIATLQTTTTLASDPAGVAVTAAVPGQGVVVGFIGPSGSTVSASAPFTTCAVASIHVQKSATDTTTTFTAPVGSTVTLVPIVTDSQGITLDTTNSNLSLTWLSSQPAVANVSLGTVNTAAPGIAQITAACLSPSCNVNFVPPTPVYSDNVVTGTVSGTVDSTVLVTTATGPACASTTACSNSNNIVPIDTSSNAAGSALTLPAGVQVNSMVIAASGDPAFLGTVCSAGTTGPNGASCSGLLRFDPATTTTIPAPNSTIPGTALTTDGVHVVVSSPATNQVFITTAVPGVEAIPAINVSSFIAASPIGATEAGNTVTITTTAPHGLMAGQLVLVAGVGVAGYNGVQTVQSVPSTTTFTYTDTNSGLAASGGGYATGGASAAISPDGSKIYIVAGNKLFVYQQGLPLISRTLSGNIDPTSLQTVAFFATGAMAYVADSGGDDVFAPCSDALMQTVAVSGFPNYIAAVPTATATVDVNPTTSTIGEIDVTPNSPTAFGVCPPNVTNSRVTASVGAAFTPTQVIVTPDGKLALILADKGVVAYTVGSKPPAASLIQLTGGARALAGGVTPDGNSLYVGASDGAVHRLDLTKTPPADVQTIGVNLCPTVAAGCTPDFIVIRPVATVASLSSLTVTPAKPTVGVGATQQFTATGTFSDHTTRDMTNFVTWISSNPVVAVIGPTTAASPPITTPGLAKGLAAGTVTITAASGGITGTTTLTVQ